MSSLDKKTLTNLRELDEKGQPSIVEEIGEIFMAGAPGLITQMKAHLKAGNSAAARAEAHKLKSSSGNIGALRLAELCGELEYFTGNDEVKSMEALVAKMEIELAQVLSDLQLEMKKAA